MSQKFIKKKQTSPKSLGYGKFYAKAVYNQKHITTRQLADFIQTQASVKRSDCIAVLDELGFALRHFIGLGEKVKIENVGIFKCGVRNKRGGFEDAKDLFPLFFVFVQCCFSSFCLLFHFLFVFLHRNK